MDLIAFSGYARAGKDEAAKALAELGYERVAFADKLRKVLLALNPVVATVDVGWSTTVRVKDVVLRYGWDGYKETSFGPEIRTLLQRLGTECGRDLIHPDVWVNAALDNLDESGKYVVTDCRFLNEADGVRSRGGKIFRINRPGIGPANSHISETGLDDYDFDGVIENGGTLEDFRRKVLEVASRN